MSIKNIISMNALGISPSEYLNDANVVPVDNSQYKSNASNFIGLISDGISNIRETLSAPQRRAESFAAAMRAAEAINIARDEQRRANKQLDINVERLALDKRKILSEEKTANALIEEMQNKNQVSRNDAQYAIDMTNQAEKFSQRSKDVARWASQAQQLGYLDIDSASQGFFLTEKGQNDQEFMKSYNKAIQHQLDIEQFQKKNVLDVLSSKASASKVDDITSPIDIREVVNRNLELTSIQQSGVDAATAKLAKEQNAELMAEFGNYSKENDKWYKYLDSTNEDFGKLEFANRENLYNMLGWSRDKIDNLREIVSDAKESIYYKAKPKGSLNYKGESITIPEHLMEAAFNSSVYDSIKDRIILKETRQIDRNQLAKNFKGNIDEIILVLKREVDRKKMIERQQKEMNTLTSKLKADAGLATILSMK